MSGTLVTICTGVPAGTQQNFKILGTVWYRVPATFSVMPTPKPDIGPFVGNFDKPAVQECECWSENRSKRRVDEDMPFYFLD